MSEHEKDPFGPRETRWEISETATRIRDLDLPAVLAEGEGLLLGTAPGGEAVSLDPENGPETGPQGPRGPLFSGTLVPMDEARPGLVRALSGRVDR